MPLPSLQQILVASLKSGWKTEFILCCVGYPVHKILNHSLFSCHFLWGCHSRTITKSISVFVLMYLDDEFKLYMITQQWIVTPPRWNINILFSGACRKISSTREQNKMRAARKIFLFWGWAEMFWGWVFWGWNTMFWGLKWWWVTTQTAPKWISYYMQTLNIIYLTLGRIRDLNISFKIHVATCSMQYYLRFLRWSVC